MGLLTIWNDVWSFASTECVQSWSSGIFRRWAMGSSSVWGDVQSFAVTEYVRSCDLGIFQSWWPKVVSPYSEWNRATQKAHKILDSVERCALACDTKLTLAESAPDIFVSLEQEISLLKFSLDNIKCKVPSVNMCKAIVQQLISNLQNRFTALAILHPIVDDKPLFCNSGMFLDVSLCD